MAGKSVSAAAANNPDSRRESYLPVACVPSALQPCSRWPAIPLGKRGSSRKVSLPRVVRTPVFDSFRAFQGSTSGSFAHEHG